MKALALFLIAAFGFPQEKAAVPKDAELKEAEKLVRDLFKDEFAKKAPADKRLLARKLLGQGKEPGNTAATQYTLLSLSIEQAVQAVDLETAMAALTDLEKVFAIDVVTQRAGVLASLSKAVKTPEDAKAAANGYLALADEAMKADRFDDAAKAATEAGVQARRAKEVPLVGVADAKSKEIAGRRARFEKIRKARETLATSPEDPEANLTVGQYTCLAKGDWAAGLRLLAKAPDGPWKAAALKDAANPDAPAEKAAAGDAWWDAAETAAAEEKSALRERAATWYSQALAKLTGLGKAKVEKRLIQLNADRIARGTWVDFSDPAQFGWKGKSGEPMEVDNPKITLILLTSKPFPPGEYDGFTVRVRLKTADGASIFYSSPGNAKQIPIFFGSKLTRTIQFPGDNPPTQLVPFEPVEEYVMTVLHSGREDVLYANGIYLGRYPNPGDKIESLSIHCDKGITLVDRIKLRKRA